MRRSVDYPRRDYHLDCSHDQNDGQHPPQHQAGEFVRTVVRANQSTDKGREDQWKNILGLYSPFRKSSAQPSERIYDDEQRRRRRCPLGISPSHQDHDGAKKNPTPHSNDAGKEANARTNRERNRQADTFLLGLDLWLQCIHHEAHSCNKKNTGQDEKVRSIGYGENTSDECCGYGEKDERP